MCSHTWKKVNSVWVCVKCGLTKTFDGKMVFDRELPNRIYNKEKKGKNKR